MFLFDVSIVTISNPLFQLFIEIEIVKKNCFEKVQEKVANCKEVLKMFIRDFYSVYWNLR